MFSLEKCWSQSKLVDGFNPGESHACTMLSSFHTITSSAYAFTSPFKNTIWYGIITCSVFYDL